VSSHDTRFNEWSIDIDHAVVLPGGHGEDIIRDFLIPDGHRVIFTCGEDGYVRQWTGLESNIGGDIEAQSAKRKHQTPQPNHDKRRRQG